MEEENKKKESGEITRRDFLKDAGLVVGGAAIGSSVLLAACGGEGETITATKTVFVCPYCSEVFESLSELQAHIQAEHPTEHMPKGDLINLTVNGQEYWVKIKPNWSLSFVLKEIIGLPGLKIGCNQGTCGTCAVIVDGKSIFSCLMLAIEAEGKEILTIEGLSDNITLHPIQQAFVDNDAVQCGYCVPGFIMAAKSLLDENPNPTFDEVREGLSGHICPCGNSKRMVEAVLAVKGGS